MASEPLTNHTQLLHRYLCTIC